MNEFIAEWGYLAVYVATALEGEFAYLSAIVASSLGHLKVYWVMFAAFFGGYTRDMTIFLTARYSGKEYLKRRPKSKEKIERAGNWVRKYPLFLAVHRFAYGVSTGTVVALAVSSMSTLRFTLVCAVACLTWTIGYAALGYFAADQVIENITWLQEHFWYIFLGIVLIILLVIKFKKD